ncbi:MAG TPA: tRNA pseudouridine(38-40) synthase TruA [Bryobacteraceae bacterium]|nr:tRNA pseudouridine(38-40) synthase TruA [Bryobacteraceae bacterium]
MRRIRLVLSYDGTDYHGWQVQPGLPTVQGVLESAFLEIEKSPVKIEGSGRTDAGVHARAQIAAVTIKNPIPPANLRKALNRLLPGDIRVLDVAEVAPNFHPRFDALSKTYEYRIWRGETMPPFERRWALHHPFPADDHAFMRSAPLFMGEHDFSVFAAADETDSLGRSKVRTIFSSAAEKKGDLLIYRVNGSGFLKHMVRNIVGTLLEAAKGNADADRIRYMLTAPPGVRANPMAPARGLWLIRVFY